MIDEIAATTELADHVKLWTRREYKKSRVHYFSGQTAQWERRHAADRQG